MKDKTKQDSDEIINDNCYPFSYSFPFFPLTVTKCCEFLTTWRGCFDRIIRQIAEPAIASRVCGLYHSTVSDKCPECGAAVMLYLGIIPKFGKGSR
jgi:hypothetical protein